MADDRRPPAPQLKPSASFDVLAGEDGKLPSGATRFVMTSSAAPTDGEQTLVVPAAQSIQNSANTVPSGATQSTSSVRAVPPSYAGPVRSRDHDHIAAGDGARHQSMLGSQNQAQQSLELQPALKQEPRQVECGTISASVPNQAAMRAKYTLPAKPPPVSTTPTIREQANSSAPLKHMHFAAKHNLPNKPFWLASGKGNPLAHFYETPAAANEAVQQQQAQAPASIAVSESFMPHSIQVPAPSVLLSAVAASEGQQAEAEVINDPVSGEEVETGRLAGLPTRDTLRADERHVYEPQVEKVIELCRETLAGVEGTDFDAVLDSHGSDCPVWYNPTQENMGRSLTKARKVNFTTRRFSEIMPFFPDRGYNISTHAMINGRSQPWLSLRFGCCSQVPSLELDVTMSDGTIVSATIWAPHMDHTQESNCFKMLAPDSPRWATKFAGLDLTPRLNALQEASLISWVGMRFSRPGQKDVFNREVPKILIGGQVSLSDRAAWAQAVSDAGLGQWPNDNGNPLSMQEVFLGYLGSGQCSALELFIPHTKGREAFLESYTENRTWEHTTLQRDEAWEFGKMAVWFTTVMNLSIRLGNLWFYRWQVPNFCRLDQIIDFKLIKIAPWLVQTWYMTQAPTEEELHALAESDRDGGTLTARPKIPVAATWAPLLLPDGMPWKEEMSFCLSKAQFHERKRQEMQINYLLEDTHPSKSFEARFIFNRLERHSMLVELITGIEYNSLHTCLPSAGTKCTLTFTAEDDVTRPKLTGLVTNLHNIPGAQIVLACLADDRHQLEGLGDEVRLQIWAEFSDEFKPYARQVQAMRWINDNDRGEGEPLDPVRFLMSLGQDIKPVASGINTKRFEKHLADSKLNLNEIQIQAAMQSVLSESLAVINNGPPGTGKTKTNIGATLAFVEQSVRVLIATPTNAARDAAASAWVKGLDEHDDEAFKARMQLKFCIKKTSYNHSDRTWKHEREFHQLPEGIEAEEHAYWSLISSIHEDDLDDDLENYGFAAQRFKYALMMATEYNEVRAAEYVSLIRRYRYLKKHERAYLAELDEEFTGEFLSQCLVVFVTCSSGWDQHLILHFPAKVIILDEAAAVTLSDAAVVLIAFANSCTIMMFSGDPQQQEPFALSHDCNDCIRLLNRSLLTMIEDSRRYLTYEQCIPEVLLDTQYRMHPDIVRWPNATFYDRQLKNAPRVMPDYTPRDRIDNTIDRAMAGCETYFDGRQSRRILVDQCLSRSSRLQGTTSLINRGEVEAIVNMVRYFLTFQADQSTNEVQIHHKDIIVITPYLAQQVAIKSALASYTNIGANKVKVYTSFGSQGHEAPIVLISLVVNRAEKPYSTKFIAQGRQLNVELTRASKLCMVVGAFSTWLQNMVDETEGIDYPNLQHLLSFVEDGMDRGDIITYSKLMRAFDPAKANPRYDHGLLRSDVQEEDSDFVHAHDSAEASPPHDRSSVQSAVQARDDDPLDAFDSAEATFTHNRSSVQPAVQGETPVLPSRKRANPDSRARFEEYLALGPVEDVSGRMLNPLESRKKRTRRNTSEFETY